MHGRLSEVIAPPSSLFAVARPWLHFHNLEMRRRPSRPSISARRYRLISDKDDRLSDIGTKVNRRTINLVGDSIFIHEPVFVRVTGTSQATGNLAVSFWFWRLTESKDWRNHQDRQHESHPYHGSPLLWILQRPNTGKNWQN